MLAHPVQLCMHRFFAYALILVGLFVVVFGYVSNESTFSQDMVNLIGSLMVLGGILVKPANRKLWWKDDSVPLPGNDPARD